MRTTRSGSAAVAERLVINTGPVVALARIGELDLVPRLGLDVVCPSEVRAELDAGAAAGHPAADVPWITVIPLTAPPSPIAAIVLDAGEAAVIQLALELSVTRVCIDDWKGRRAAKAVGLEVTGSLGLLLRARTLGLIPAVRPLIERAVAAGVGYDAELIRRVLASVGE